MYEHGSTIDVGTRQILAQMIMSNTTYDEEMWRTVAGDLIRRSDMDVAMGALLRTSGRVMDVVSWIHNYRRKLGEDAICDAVGIALNAVYGGMLRYHFQSEEKSEDERGHFHYVPFTRATFAKLMLKLGPHTDFMDVGCGIGDKPFIYWLVTGCTAHGVEMNDHTYELGKYATHLYRKYVKLIHHDAFDITYEDYGVVYMYLPIGGREKMADLYRHVYSTMHRGSILIEALPRKEFHDFAGEHDLQVELMMGGMAVVEV